MAKNKLFFGDNLEVLRGHIKDETIDLIYLDPPFNSNANYNVFFGEQEALARKLKLRPSATHGNGAMRRGMHTMR